MTKASNKCVRPPRPNLTIATTTINPNPHQERHEIVLRRGHLQVLYVGVLLGLGFQPRFDALVLLVEVVHVWDEVLLDVHVRQRIHFHWSRVLREGTGGG